MPGEVPLLRFHANQIDSDQSEELGFFFQEDTTPDITVNNTADDHTMNFRVHEGIQLNLRSSHKKKVLVFLTSVHEIEINWP